MCPSSISTRYLFQNTLRIFPTKIIQKKHHRTHLRFFTKIYSCSYPVTARKFPYTELPYALVPWWNATDWWVVDTPGKINGWNLRIRAPWKRRNIFQPIIFRFYVNLGGCSVSFQRCVLFFKDLGQPKYLQDNSGVTPRFPFNHQLAVCGCSSLNCCYTL